MRNSNIRISWKEGVFQAKEMRGKVFFKKELEYLKIE